MTWTVWVGGSEINSHYLSQAEAVSVARAWIAEVYLGKHCSDYTLYEGNKRLEDKPAWLEKAEQEDANFSFMFFIDNLAWEYEQRKEKV